jgi:hypothetical protein
MQVGADLCAMAGASFMALVLFSHERPSGSSCRCVGGARCANLLDLVSMRMFQARPRSRTAATHECTLACRWAVIRSMRLAVAARMGAEPLSMSAIRSPKLTVLCRGTKRVWFLLHRGQFHRSPTTPASAPHSTGVFTLRGTPGELAQIDGGVQIAVQDLAAICMLAAKHAV